MAPSSWMQSTRRHAFAAADALPGCLESCSARIMEDDGCRDPAGRVMKRRRMRKKGRCISNSIF